MFALAATLAALSLAAGPTRPAEPAQGQVRLTLNGGDYQPGDRVKVEVETDNDGYLVVFRVDGDGYVRVLFPLDPDLDPFVRGGRRYELRGRGDHESFLADDRGGTGLVLAALSREPLNFNEFATGSHWDYERVRLDDPAGDAEAQLLGLVRRMTDNGRFDYDVVGYRVWGPGYEQAAPTIVAGGGYDPYWDSRFSCLACGWGYPRTGFGITIGSGYYDPWWDPYYYGGYYRYGSTTRGWNGFWGWDPYWGTPYRPITVINTYPRPTVPNPIYGDRSRPRQPVTTRGTPRLSDPVGRPAPRPSNSGSDRSRRPNGSTGSAPAPRSSGAPQASPSRGSAGSPAPAPSSSGSRSRSRRPDQLSLPVAPTPIPTLETRRAEERPVYRPPVQTTTSREAPRVEPRSRPASSPPPRVELPTRRSAPEPRVERPMPRSAPEMPRSAPAPRVERSAPPPSSAPAPSGGSSSPRSRGRPDN